MFPILDFFKFCKNIIYFFIKFIEIESHVAENKQIENRSQSTSRLEPSWKSALTHWEPVDFINIFTYVGDYRLDPITPRKDNKKIDAGILRNFHISNPDNVYALPLTRNTHTILENKKIYNFNILKSYRYIFCQFHRFEINFMKKS